MTKPPILPHPPQPSHDPIVTRMRKLHAPSRECERDGWSYQLSLASRALCTPRPHTPAFHGPRSAKCKQSSFMRLTKPPLDHAFVGACVRAIRITSWAPEALRTEQLLHLGNQRVVWDGLT